MGWIAYTLTYRAVAPVLLGDHPLGFVQRTRTYAPGWTLWGAITARLTRALLTRASGADYKKVGQFVAENLLTSYGCILVDDEPTMPRHEDGQLHYGPLTAAQFEARFLASLGQTGVAPATLTAHTGTLHETEVLVEHDRETKEAVRWQFKLYVRQPWPDFRGESEQLTVQDVLEVLESLTIGADRGYGLGSLVHEKEKLEEHKEVEGQDWPHPLDWSPQNRLLQAHVPFDELPGEQVRGRVEAVPRRWWQNDPDKAWGPGQKREVRRFYVPGSRVIGGEWIPEVRPMGIWQKARQSGVPQTTP